MRLNEKVPPLRPEDRLVVDLIRQGTHCDEVALQCLQSRWQRATSANQSLMDYLIENGLIDRIAARAVVHILNGVLKHEDFKQLVSIQHIQAIMRQWMSEEQSLESGAGKRRELLPLGTQIGRYVIKGILGHGGHGTVYLGFHPNLKIPVAIKRISRQSATDRMVEYIEKEAHLLAKIQHPHIIRVWDIEITADAVCLVMEYIDGDNLENRLRRMKRIPTEEVRAIGLATTRAIEHSHRANILHGDIKPANILESLQGEVKLCDFGLARHLHAKDPKGSDTDRRRIEGTWAYMAPERFDGIIHPASDIYSLGLTLYHLMCGLKPVEGCGVDDYLRKHRRLNLEPLHYLVADCSRELSSLILRMAASDPESRPDITEIRSTLEMMK